MEWREYRLEKSGRRGWEIVLPRFGDEEHPENAERMNRFYGTAAEEMEKAANLAARTDARRVRYRCETEVKILTDPGPSDEGKYKPPEPEKKKRLFPRLVRMLRTVRGRGKRAKPEPPEKGRPGDVRVSLRLSLAVSGQRTREKTLVQLWRDGILLSSLILL